MSGIENAREIFDLVLAAALQLAKRVIDHIDEHDSVKYVAMDDVLDGGGFDWHLTASYGKGHNFVTVGGHPVAHPLDETDEQRAARAAGIVTTIEELAEVTQSNQASFSANVPRQWVELAVLASTAIEP